MNKKLVLSASLLVAIYCVGSIAFPPYNRSKKPDLSLPEAYMRAVQSLEVATNRYYCVNASLTTTLGAEGEWSFLFCSAETNAISKLICVQFDGKVTLDNGLR
jgi:hypothetical protein